MNQSSGQLLLGVLSDLHLAAPGPLRFSVAPANAWGQEGAALTTAAQ